MIHSEVSEFLPLFVLDALERHERAGIDAHLELCPRCRSECDALREVTAALGTGVCAPPGELWLEICDQLPARDVDRTVSSPKLRPVHVQEQLGDASSFQARSNRRWMAITGASIVSAAAITTLLGIGLVDADSRTYGYQGLGASDSPSVVAALEQPNHRLIDLASASNRTLAQFVLADGRGYLVSSRLPELPSGETYQLWGVVQNEPISLGLLGRSLNQSTFTLTGAPTPSRLNVTVEPAGGSIVPTGETEASGLA